MESKIENVYQSAHKLLVPLASKKTFATVVDEARKLVDAQYGTIFLLEGSVLKRVYASSPAVDITKEAPKHVQEMFRKHTPHVKIIKNKSDIHPKLFKLGIKSIIFVPLSYDSKLSGALVIHSKKAKLLSQEDLRLLKIFGLFASLTIEKNQQYAQIKKALDARDTFISLASHEIKTPLTTVYGYAQIIKRTLTAGKSPKLQWVNTLLFETHRVTLLVNELLQVEHVKTGKLNYRLKKCSLHLVIKRAMMDFAFIYPSHKLIFKNNLGKQPDFVQGDFDKLLQVILNILTNAGRFSSEKSTVRIALTHEKNYLIIKISDWGKGIEKKDLSRIFQRFYKADKTSKGLGLGLYLAKEVVDEHGGTIEINSKLGHGTAVTICLPKLKK